MRRINHYYYILFIIIGMSVSSCKDKDKDRETPALFQVLDAKQTGLDFTNTLKATKEFNMFNYMYFYNGGGVGAGDFNNDGLIDLFFSSNQGDNKLYINKGQLRFEDVTTHAKIPQDNGWSTGVSVVDINNDGLLDIYVCQVGKYEILNSRNQFLICQGIDKQGVPYYIDKAAEYGLDFSGFSTQAVFFDYDLDGDNDMFLLNHAVHQNGSFASRSNFTNTYSELSGDRMFRNDAVQIDTSAGRPVFKDITRQVGINSTAIGYGLGVVAADINNDGYPDLYVGNDFHENDYLYINQRNGKFREENNMHLMHTSKFSMGVDIADINNDGCSEIISMDMLPADPYILKRSLGDDEYDIFLDKIASGYNYQYSRNALQFNRRNGMFSEVGLYAGVPATDWSWAPLWMDFDNDGLKDLFISNGIPKRLNDMDYINFVSSEEIQKKVNQNKMDENNMALVEKFPEIKIPNKFFKNEGRLKFSDIADSIGNDKPTYSNGAIYADLDNDGDLDVVVNNIDEPVLLYENKANDRGDKSYADIKLTGPAENRNAIGARIILFSGTEMRTYENFPVRGFQSSMQVPVHIGLAGIRPDSVLLVWPDNSVQNISLANDSLHLFNYQAGLKKIDLLEFFQKFRASSLRVMEDITAEVDFKWKHIETSFNEFNREPLIPHMLSTEGPALAVADINKDGLDDVFIGSSKAQHPAIMLQVPGGRFTELMDAFNEADSMYEDVDAIWADVNNDGFKDLVIASGGNEFYGNDKHRSPRLFLNESGKKFTFQPNAFSNIFLTASTITAADFNKDGAIDLFIGGRAIPWEYGEVPNSYLLQNDGTGKFSNMTDQLAAGLSKIGMVTNAVWADMDKDGDEDLLVACEWGYIEAFINAGGRFTKKQLTKDRGWWNFLLPVDLNGDGALDLVAGNLGMNSRLTATREYPVTMYYNDFDDNGKKEQVLTYFIGQREIPFVNKDELQKKLPFIKKKFLYAGDFAKASISEIFGSDKLKKAIVLKADYFSNATLLNKGGWEFETNALPWEAQFSPYRDAVVVDANRDSLPDILLIGNYYDNNIQMGRYDADFGTVLVNEGGGRFSCETIPGVVLKGQSRRVRRLRVQDRETFLIARNNDSVVVLGYRAAKQR
jgi:hypothetical protein